MKKKKKPETILGIPVINAPAGNPFTIDYKVLEYSMKGAPKNYISFVKNVVKRVNLANAAYAALSCAQIQITNMNGILSKAKDTQVRS
jgi:hypothetical protein